MEGDLEKKRTPSPGDSSNTEDGTGVTQSNDGPLFTRFIDSFRQNANARMSPIVLDDDGKPLENQPPAQPALAMKLKNRHLQMIAIGGSIGTFCISLVVLIIFRRLRRNDLDSFVSAERVQQ